MVWQVLDVVEVPEAGGERLRLFERHGEYAIRVGLRELMSSRAHGSEQALAELACAAISGRSRARVLVGGLGMGFTLRAALDHLTDDAEVVVAELVPQVVGWNREHFGHLAGHPLRDPRVRVQIGDVRDVLATAPGVHDVILLDVDNGPQGLTRQHNDRLYARRGLELAKTALCSGGVLGVWSASPNDAFRARLQGAGFVVEEHQVAARGKGGGPEHVIWVARA